MSARSDNNFLEMMKALPVRGGATPRVVTFTSSDVAKCEAARSRRVQRVSVRLTDATVLGRVVGILMGSK